MGHSRPHCSAWREEDAAPGRDGVRSPGCHMPRVGGTGAPGEQEAGRGQLPALPSPVTAAALPEEAALPCSPGTGYKYPPHFNTAAAGAISGREQEAKPCTGPGSLSPAPGWAGQCPGATKGLSEAQEPRARLDLLCLPAEQADGAEAEP